MVSDYRGSTYTITANSAILILFLIHDYKNHNVLFVCTCTLYKYATALKAQMVLLSASILVFLHDTLM